MSLQDHSGETVLVTGATGMIGQAVIATLLRKGYRVRAMTHRGQNVPKDPNVSILLGDIRDEAFVKKAVTGTTYVIHLAARKSDEKDSMAVNADGAELLGRTAKAAGVRRLMNISTQSVKLPTQGMYAKSKEAGDRKLIASGVPMTTLRLSVVYGDRTSGILGSLISFSKLPIVPVIGDGKVLFWPIHRDDAADAIVALMEKPEAEGRTYDAGGPDAWSFNDLLRECGKRKGVMHMRIVHIPIPIALVAAKLLRVLPHPPITVSNVLGSAAIVRMDPLPFFHDIGFMPRSVEKGFDTVFAEEEKGDAESVALLKYVLPALGSARPDQETVDRFTHALSVYGIQNHSLDPRVIGSAWLLGMIDAAAALRNKNCILRQKLLIAAAIMECTPDSADTYLPHDRTFLEVCFICILCACSAGTKLALGLMISLITPSFYRRNAGC